MSALSEHSQSKDSVSDVECVAAQQTVAIAQLEENLKTILDENERLLKKQSDIEHEISKTEASAVQRCIALEVRLGLANALLPFKRRKFDVAEKSGIDALYQTGELNPAVNFVYQKAYEAAQAEKTRLQQSFDDLVAWKFSPDSVNGRRLMACMRDLLETNERLGSENQVDRIDSLVEETGLQATAVKEQTANNEELEAHLQDSLTDLEGAQSTLLILKQQLNRANELICALKDACDVENPGQADALIAAALATFSEELVDPRDLDAVIQNACDENNALAAQSEPLEERKSDNDDDDGGFGAESLRT